MACMCIIKLFLNFTTRHFKTSLIRLFKVGAAGSAMRIVCTDYYRCFFNLYIKATYNYKITISSSYGWSLDWITPLLGKPLNSGGWGQLMSIIYILLYNIKGYISSWNIIHEHNLWTFTSRNLYWCLPAVGVTSCCALSGLEVTSCGPYQGQLIRVHTQCIKCNSH